MGRISTRDLQKEASWRRRLRRQAKSGQSVRAWCRRHGVTESGFYWWRRELARRDAEAHKSRPRGTDRPRFVPVRVAEAPVLDSEQPHSVQPDGAGRIEIVLADGRCIRLTGPVHGQTLANVLDALERRAC